MKLAPVDAYKFLAAGARYPFTRAPWPAPGEWVAVGDDACDLPSGVRVCRPSDLPYWLDDELWEMEFDGDIIEERYSLVAPRARLVRQLATWTSATTRELTAACAWRARDEIASRLRAAGLETLADALGAPDTLEALTKRANELAADAPPAWIDPLGLVGECGSEAEAAHVRPATAILTATVTIAGWDDDAQAVERAWQADWICHRLGLEI
jgi:hypothetical protein